MCSIHPPTQKLAWGQQTDEIWNTVHITWQPKGFTALTPKTVYENPISQYNYDDWNQGVMKRYGQAPKNLVGSLAYTEEEVAQLGTSETDLGVYVRECMTRFVIGEMDIEGLGRVPEQPESYVLNRLSAPKQRMTGHMAK